MILSVKNISKTYHFNSAPIEVLQDISFEVRKADTVAITGQSGSGKSTLLALLAGLETPSSGHIELNNQNLNLLNEDEMAKFRANSVGIIFQQIYLMPHLTALENVSLPLEILRKKNIEDKAILALEKVNLSHRKHHFPSQLSGGENQRVAIARALVVEPAILLADEPTGNLDNKSGVQVRDLLFDLVESNEMTLLLVTHNVDLALHCNRQYILKEGKFISMELK